MSMDHLHVLLGEVSIQVLCSFFNWVVVFLVLSHMHSLYMLEIKSFSNVLLEICSPIQWVPFSFCRWFLLLAESFKPGVVPFVYCLFPLPEEIYWQKYCCMGYLKFYCLCFPLGLLWYHDLCLSLLSVLSLFWCMV